MPLKKRAHVLVHTKCAQFARAYGVSFTRLSIGSARTRWGSCSSKGALRFNYRIAALPAALADYIIVHEICHLRHMNHSPAFWKEVARSVPQHRALRAILRRTAFSFNNRIY